MYFCEDCGMPINGEVIGTGDDATAFCDNCREWMNCFKEKEIKQTFDPNEKGL